MGSKFGQGGVIQPTGGKPCKPPPHPIINQHHPGGVSLPTFQLTGWVCGSPPGIQGVGKSFGISGTLHPDVPPSEYDTFVIDPNIIGQIALVQDQGKNVRILQTSLVTSCGQQLHRQVVDVSGQGKITMTFTDDAHGLSVMLVVNY